MTRDKIYRMLSMGDFELELHLKEHDCNEEYLKKIVRMKESAVDSCEADLYKSLTTLENFIKQRTKSIKAESIFMPFRNSNSFYSEN